MTLTARPAAEFTSAQLADALNAAFEGYVLPVSFDARSLDERLRPEHLDPHASLLFFDHCGLAGAAMIARRGWTSRLSAMGVVARARRQGYGARMLAVLTDQARARSDHRLILEVIEQNPRAVSLYQQAGFIRTGRLVGYTRPDYGPSAQPEPLTDVDPLYVARLVTRHGPDDLPWALAGETLAALPQARGLTLDGHAHAIVSEHPLVTVLHALIVPEPRRREGRARALLNAVQRRLGTPLRVIPVMPEHLAAAFFRATGFEPETLSQFQMERRLD